MLKAGRAVCVFMAAMIVLSGCQKGKGGSDAAEDTGREVQEREESGGSETESENGREQEEDKEQQEGKEQQEEESSGNQTDLRESITIDISEEYIGEWEDGKQIIQGSSSKLHVLDEGYEDFQAVMDEYGETDWREIQEIYQEYLPEAKERFAENGYTDYEISRKICLERADNRIVSFTNSESSYLGGAHGSYYTRGGNYDPVSGRQLSLKDVVKDYDQVYEYTKDYLERENDAEAFFPDYQDTLKNMFYGDAGEADPLEWSMDTGRILLYFNQYVLGPYASGAFIVELPFVSEGQQMVKDPYLSDTSGTVKRVWEGIEVAAADSSGESKSLSYTIQSDEMNFTSTISLQWGQQSTEMEMHGEFEQAYLFRKADGQLWLYAECLEENDWRAVYVFDLNQEIPVYVDSTSDFIGEHLVDDPEDFVLYSHLDTLGTYLGFRHYRVGDNGMPEAMEQVYTIVNYDRGWGEYAITSKTEIPVRMHGDRGENGTEEMLPAGTRFYLRRTDTESFVEMELEDGRRCDILIEKDGYFSRINGISEEECFEGLRYAG